MAEVAPNDPCLFYMTGLSLIDIQEHLSSLNTRVERIFAVGRRTDGSFCGADFHNQDSLGSLSDSDVDMEIDGEYYADEAEVAEAALDRGVTWVVPSTQCADTYALAQIAEQIGANYPSPKLVYRIEDKPTFYRQIAGDGVPVPETRTCQTAEQIERAVEEIGKLCVIKTANGHSSLALKSADGSRPLDDADKRNIADHEMVRNGKGIAESIVQESVGPDEYGMQALVEMSDAGIEIVWAASTRKLIVPPYGRLAAHIVDPADEERVAITEDLLLPTVSAALERLAAGAPDMLRSRIGRYALNCDFRSDGTKAWWIDGSFRWAPRFQLLGNADLGEFALSSVMPSIAERWAQGKPVDPSEFVTGKPRRAVIMRKAFTAIGGTILRYNRLGALSMPAEVFHAQAPCLGDVLPGPDEDSPAAAIDEFPLICVDGVDIREAEATWHGTLALLELEVGRDGAVYDAYSEMAA